MRSRLAYLPAPLCLITVIVLLWHGPILQLSHYHAFADQSTWLGIPHAHDVLSNLPFALLALWGGLKLRQRLLLDTQWPARWGWGLFLAGLLGTAIGSAYYHWAPDDARLFWDRLPLALTTAGLMAAVRAETRPGIRVLRYSVLIVLFAVAGVVWWAATQAAGVGDLRPYLLLQGLALVLIPLWQAAYEAPRADRLAFGAAMLLYLAAKLAELNDHAIQLALGWMSGHTLKHLLAGLAAALIVSRLHAKAPAGEAGLRRARDGGGIPWLRGRFGSSS